VTAYVEGEGPDSPKGGKAISAHAKAHLNPCQGHMGI
jgi:hypothetical protein